MKLIPLSRGLFAKVDDSDFELLCYCNWYALDGRLGLLYAHNQHFGLMHRFLMEIHDSNIKVDHWNRDTLDNQRHNLRIATGSQNQANRKIQVNSTTGAKGVNVRKETGKYRARIMRHGQRILLGEYRHIGAAKEAYRVAAERLYGEFARTCS